MNNKKKFFSQMLSLILVASLLLGNMNLTTASANTGERSTVYFGTDKDDVYGTKKAEWVPGEEGTTAKITLDITAKKVMNTVKQVAKTDIVLVIDKSGSMKYNSKMSNVKTAAEEFVTGLLAGDNKKSVQIGVVTYSETANSLIASGLSNDITTINDKIRNIGTPSGGTNIQAGIRKANDILTASKIAHANNDEEVNQIIVLLSDGEPTFSYKASEYDGISQRLVFSTNEVTRMGNGEDYYLYTYSYDSSERSYSLNYSVAVPMVDTVVKYGSEYFNVDTDNLTNESNASFQETGNYIYIKLEKNRKATNWKVAKKNFLAKDRNIPGNDPNIIVLSDTSANLVLKEYTVTYTLNETRTYKVDNNGVPTIDEAANIKANSTTIYTIGYDIAADSNAEYVMSNVASTDKFKKATTTNAATSIQEILDSISTQVQQVIETANGSKIVDQIPLWFNIDESRLPSGVTYDRTTRMVTWNIGELKVPDGQDTTNKSVIFYATLDKANIDANAVAAVGNFVETNTSCTLSYLDSKEEPKTVSTKTKTGEVANPLLPLATYDYSITYIIEGNTTAGGNLEGSTSTVSGKAFLGEKVSVNSTLEALSLNASQYQNPVITGNVTNENGNKYVIIGSDSQLNEATVNVDLNRFTVTFYSKEAGASDNTVFGTAQTVIYGTSATKPLTSPMKAADAQYTYSFLNWSLSDNLLANITSNLDLYPIFKNDLQNYTITFYKDQAAFDSNSVYAQYPVKYGTNTITAPTNPSAPTYVDSYNNYTFTGWNLTPAQWQNVSGNVVVIGSFTEELKISEVYFYDITGARINDDPQLVQYGKSATEPTKFTKEDVLQEVIHIFNGTWDTPFDKVETPVLHVKANFDTISLYYTVNYYSSSTNGTWLDTQKIKYMTPSTYAKETPVKVDSTNQYTYTFNNTWNNADGTSAADALASVVSDMNVYAGFNKSENTFTFTFSYWNENGVDVVTKKSNIPWGTAITAPNVTSTSGGAINREFKSWSGDDFNYVTKDGYATATADITYSVTFIYGDNEREVQFIPQNGIAIPPTDTSKSSDSVNHYNFTGWDVDATELNNVTKPMIVNAKYESLLREYKVDFINDVTGETIQSYTGKNFNDIVDVPSPVNTIVDKDMTYTFSRWTNDINTKVIVEGDATYRAYYKSEPTKYEVTFKDVIVSNDSDVVIAGDRITSAMIDYNKPATAPSMDALTQSKNTAKYTYTFVGWVTAPDGDVAADLTMIQNTTTVYASYTRELVKYTVIFKDDAQHQNAEFAVEIDGNLVTHQQVEYGESAYEPNFTQDEDTVEKVFLTPYWNSNAWKNVMTNGQGGENRTIIITLVRNFVPQRYEVTFFSEDGSTKLVPETGVYEFDYGTNITSYPGQQSKERTKTHDYTFAGWGTEKGNLDSKVDVSTITVTGSGITFYALFNELDHYYTVTFLDENGNNFPELQAPYQIKVLYEQSAIGDSSKVVEDKAIEYANNMSSLSTTVTFRGWSLTQKTEGQALTDLTSITKDITVFAMNEDSTNKYTVTYMSDEYEATNNGIFAADIVTGGAIVSFANSDQENTYVIRQAGPTKTSDSHLFTFDHWRVFVKDGEEFFELFGDEGEVEARYSTETLIEALQTNLYLFPVFESSVKTFTVTFQDFDGRVLKTETGVVYDKPATAPTNPTRSDVYTSTTRTVYTFNGWDVDFTKIKADTTVTARYSTVTYDITPSTPVTPTTTPTVAPTPVVEDIEDLDDITEDIPQGTPEIPQGTPEVDNEDDSLPAEDTDDEVLDIDGNVIPQGTPELPQTGTAPVGIFYGIGIACAFIGASIIISSRKKREEEC